MMFREHQVIPGDGPRTTCVYGCPGGSAGRRLQARRVRQEIPRSPKNGIDSS